MRRYDESVVVQTDDRGLPQRVIWRNRLYQVLHIEEEWRYAGKWWIDSKGWHRRYYRASVRASHNSTQCEMQFYKHGVLWTLSGIYD